MSDDIIEIALLEAEERMENAVGYARSQFGGVRTGRATSALVERLNVDYFGAEVPLMQLASFSVPEARLLVITPFDKGSIESIEKAIRESDLGLSPATDGVVVRLAFPALTAERRKDLVKVVRSMAEEARVTIRNARRGARTELDQMKKDGDAREDAVGRAESAVDNLTKKYEGQVDEALATKDDELMEV